MLVREQKLGCVHNAVTIVGVQARLQTRHCCTSKTEKIECAYNTITTEEDKPDCLKIDAMPIASTSTHI